MAIARKNSIKKNKKPGRKTRVVIRRGGSRKMNLKGGAAGEGPPPPFNLVDTVAAGGCEGARLDTVVVEIFDGSKTLHDGVGNDMSTEIAARKKITVCYDPDIKAGRGRGLLQGKLLGNFKNTEELVKEFVTLVHQDSENGIFKTTLTASETAELGEQVYNPVDLQGKYLHPVDNKDPSKATRFILWNRHEEIPMNPYYFANALNAAREVLSLYTDAAGVMYLPDVFAAEIAKYLEQIKRGSNVSKVLKECASKLFGYAEEKSKGFLLKMYEQATARLSEFWSNVKRDRETQIEAAKIAMTVAGMVYGGTIGTAISTAIGLSTQAASLFFSSAISLGLTGLSALLTGVGLAVSTYGACLYLMFGLSIAPNLFLAAALYSFKLRYPDASPDKFPEYLSKVLAITGIDAEIEQFRGKANGIKFFKACSDMLVKPVVGFKAFYDQIATATVLPIVDGLRYLGPKIAQARARYTEEQGRVNLKGYATQFQSITIDGNPGNPDTELTDEEANPFMEVLEPLVTGDSTFKPPVGMGGSAGAVEPSYTRSRAAAAPGEFKFDRRTYEHYKSSRNTNNNSSSHRAERDDEDLESGLREFNDYLKTKDFIDVDENGNIRADDIFLSRKLTNMLTNMYGLRALIDSKSNEINETYLKEKFSNIYELAKKYNVIRDSSGGARKTRKNLRRNSRNSNKNKNKKRVSKKRNSRK